jgi:hypothetical protein
MCAGCLLKNTPTNSKYVVNQKLEHFDDINITIGLEPNMSNMTSGAGTDRVSRSLVVL